MLQHAPTSGRPGPEKTVRPGTTWCRTMPVRSALSALQAEGLVRQMRHRGATVAPLGLEDLEVIQAVRAGIEGFAARVVDGEDNEVADGTAGELVLRAEAPFAFATGYFGAPEKTVEAWRKEAAEALAGIGPVVIVLSVEGHIGQKTPKPPWPMAEQIARLQQALGTAV